MGRETKRYIELPRTISWVMCTVQESDILFSAQQCSGSVAFLYGSGSADPYRWTTDPDPDPGLFFSGFQDAKEAKIFLSFFGSLLTVGYLHQSSKITSNTSHYDVTKLEKPRPSIRSRICTKNYGSGSGVLLFRNPFYYCVYCIIRTNVMVPTVSFHCRHYCPVVLPLLLPCQLLMEPCER